MLFDLAFDPFASRLHHYWFWTPTKFPVTWQGAPLVNFLGWVAVSLLILAFVTPMLINKRPKGKSSPDYHPLGIWLGAVLLFGLAARIAWASGRRHGERDSVWSSDRFCRFAAERW